MSRLHGSITALATPFDPSGELDLQAWRRLLQQQLDGGTQAIVVAGSTGEAATLFEPEYDLLLGSAVKFIAGRMPVLAGTGMSGTARTIEQTRRAAAMGADAALIVTPPYVRPTQAGLVAHYRAVADDGALPVVVYNVPGRTGSDLLPETLAELAGHERIIGIKEALPDAARMQALLPLKSESFAVLSGDDPTASRAMLAGADGVVSVVSNIVPNAFRLLCDLSLSGRGDRAEALVEQLRPIWEFASIESNPIPVKAVLARQGIGHGLRLPLTPLSPVHNVTADRIAGLVEEIERVSRDTLAA